jgi:hypothetical protein
MSQPDDDKTRPAGEDLSVDDMAAEVESQTSSLREADLDEDEAGKD